MLRRRDVAWTLTAAMIVVACTSGDGGDDSTSDTTDGRATTTTTADEPTVPQDVAAPPAPPAIVPVAHASASETGSTAGIPISVAVDVFGGEPVQALEFSVNGVAIEHVEFPVPNTQPTHVFEWTPTEPGAFVAEILAVGESGATSAATPVWLSVGPAPDDVADAIRAADDQLEVPPLDVATAGVVVDSGECVAQVEVSPVADAGGLIVKGATPGTPRFVALDILAAAGGIVKVPITAEPVLVRADSYTTEAVTGTTAFIVPGDEACGGEWSGDLRVEDGVLAGDRVDDVDVAYLYVSTDGANWARVPGDQGVFVHREPQGFDVEAELARVRVPDGNLEIEGWGWSGGDLVELGRGSFVHRAISGSPWIGTPITLPSELTIQQTQFDPNTNAETTHEISHGVLCLGSQTVGGCIVEPPLFHWTRFAGAEAGLLQISRLPFPGGTDVDPAGLVYAEMIPTDESSELFIPLDVRDVAGLGDRPMESGHFAYEQLEAMQADLSTMTDGPDADPRRSEKVFRGDAVAASARSSNRLFVRMVHFVDGRPTDATSSTVELTVDHSNIEVAQQPLGAGALLIDVEIDLPRQGNPKFDHCVRVVANPFGDENPPPETEPFRAPFYLVAQVDARTYTAAGAAARGLEPGATACARAPEPEDKDFLDYITDVVEFIGDAWDLYVEVWNMLQEKLVEGLVFVTGCEPEDVCTAVASGALKAGLTALGVPPTMPRFSDLVDIAKGELAEVAAAAIISESNLCPEVITAECQKIVDDSLAWVFDQIQEQVTNSALNAARRHKYELSIHPDIDVVSEPAGQLGFGFADVTVTRPAISEGNIYLACAVTFEVFATGLADWREANGLTHNEVITKRVIGPTTTVIDPNSLAPGETRSVGLVPTDFDRTTHLKGAEGYGYKPHYDAMEAWRHLMRSPSTLEARVDVCGTPFTTTAQRPDPGTPDLFPTPAPYTAP